jgi:cell division septum initiation protein DivIVA
MDIQHLVDRLEDLIDEGRHMPFSKFTMIDEERALELIDQMRISIPEEIEKAARILAQRDRIIAQANEEAARIVQLARERSDQLIDREAMVQAAQARAANIIEQARREADEISADANEYVIESLSELEETLLKALQVVRNGINKVTSDGSGSGTPASTDAVPLPVTIPAARPTVEVSAGVTTRKDGE